MADETNTTLQEAAPAAAEPKVLSPAAQRALAEAAERRKLLAEQEAALAAKKEINGRGGKDPVRYADWEVKGIAIDF